MNIRKLAVVLSLVAAGALATYGASAAQTTVSSMTVRYSDLNLSTGMGVRTLYTRLKRAAARVCGAGDSRDLSRYVKSEACYREALAGAVERVRAPALTALHQQKTSQHISG